MKKLFKGCLTIIVALVVIGVIVAIVSGGGDDTATNNSGSNSGSTEKKADDKEVENAKIGEEASTDDVAFTVNNAESVDTIKDPDGFMEPVTTSEQFIKLDVKIANNQKEAITTDASFFKLVTAEGTEYNPKNDGDIMMVMSDKTLFLEEINPGLSKEGVVVFEIPADVSMEDLTLQASAGFWGTKQVNIDLK
ncbi:DUF4352 domain-containing protein [Alkalihalobacillus macyae]|uniref:DUF4352 domain-containing protein n=1 Tax=Guptibacillus hwajinpoensis TaxID=208199 RepID=UPI00273BB2DC|nr:DUF4352 domain-containing protein [Alkalihalobacillus macyae]MDP4552922.1 DUF4352 domain-containing protein [Alkalihalobacillus macyae]